jgi:hypothetical protein
VGVIVTDSRIARKMIQVFEADWAQGEPKGKDKDKEEDARNAVANGNGRSRATA